MSAQLRSPLRASSSPTTTLRAVPDQLDQSAVRAAFQQDYATHLRASNNKHGRPYQEKTVTAYCKAVRALDQWMTAEGMEEDFLSLDTALLNRFFRWYFNGHDQGGTNTLQRNLRTFCSYLEAEYDIPNPYRDKKLQRYAPPTGAKPKTLSHDFIGELLKVTGNGHPRVRDFEKVRDHAIIRVLTEGLRAEELLTLRLDYLHLEQGLLQVVPLKDARAAGEGRIIPLQPKTVVALTRYLRARENHKLSEGEWLWLGSRNRGRLTYSGLYRMLGRRAKDCGYGSVSPHQFRHTFTDDLLSAGVSGEDVMTVAGWKDRTMLKRYAADMATTRAVKAVKSQGDRY
ncbi:site-specific integrase [Streptomyces sp. NBC_01260]|uniref:tyrosine-type recombinase/integrase n=1 Tax=Streptomyces sp. NBC_01260 TaxID=2903801 RepID=UPI002E32E461|nr:tyrosine-type recombinase/integrase [Streptomyces sp. NBC_01260]